MNISPWPSIYLPQLPIEIAPLVLQTPFGETTYQSAETKMYVCGITPYDATHLGHAATYLTFDLINRYLRLQGSTVKFAENITDIDEPLLERAQRDSVDWKSLALTQVQLFQSDMSALHIIPPQSFVPATSAMDLVESAISRLKVNGFVYELGKDLYFDVSSFLDSLPISVDEAVAVFASRGGDPLREGKKHPLDPVLWIGNRDDEPGWKSEHGFGRPGWHIECCVISLRYLLGADYLDSARSLGDASFLIDIQGGGSDLIFPHHFMSAAQAKALTGREFSASFIHTGMIGLDGEKMSKSKGNLVFVSKLIEDGCDPMVIRFALMSSHYSEDRMWSNELLLNAQNKVDRIRVNLSKTEVAPALPLLREISNALANNLDTEKALQSIEDWCTASENAPSVDEAGLVARGLDSLLGLAL